MTTSIPLPKQFAFNGMELTPQTIVILMIGNNAIIGRYVSHSFGEITLKRPYSMGLAQQPNGIALQLMPWGAPFFVTNSAERTFPASVVTQAELVIDKQLVEAYIKETSGIKAASNIDVAKVNSGKF